MVRQGRSIAVVGVLLIGCAVLLVAGASGVQAEASNKEEARCEGTRTFQKEGEQVTTNDLPGCPNKGGLLSGTDKPDKLDGEDGDDEIRGLGGKDFLYAGPGNDVLYGGPGNDQLLYNSNAGDDNVFYGGDGDDLVAGGTGEDVIYGGDGNDFLIAGFFYSGVDKGRRIGIKARGDGQRDKLYCGKGKDEYEADPNDYVDSSCEKGTLVDTGGPPLILLAGAALLLGSGLMLSRYTIRLLS